MEQALRQSGVTHDIAWTTGPGDGARIAAAAWQQGRARFLVAGGDGSEWEVAVEEFTADDLPVIGRSGKASQLSYSFGFRGSGFQMGPGTGKRLAQEILGETSPISLAPFSIQRFAAAAAQTLNFASTIGQH